VTTRVGPAGRAGRIAAAAANPAVRLAQAISGEVTSEAEAGHAWARSTMVCRAPPPAAEKGRPDVAGPRRG
jgi:hypothetical protein